MIHADKGVTMNKLEILNNNNEYSIMYTNNNVVEVLRTESISFQMFIDIYRRIKRTKKIVSVRENTLYTDITNLI